MSLEFPTFRRWIDAAKRGRPSLRQAFPTFRRMLGALPPWRSSRAQQRSLLRLILASAEENLPLKSLIASWAVDETGLQGLRLDRLVRLLESGTPLATAIEELRGVLNDEDLLAIRFGSQSGTLIPALRQRLQQQFGIVAGVAPQTRRLLVYFLLVMLIGLSVIAFLQLRVLPDFLTILYEFRMAEPTALRWSHAIGDLVASSWYWILPPLAVLAWLAFAPKPFRKLRLTLLNRCFRPVRELHLADVLDKLSIAARTGRPLAGAVSTLARYHYDPVLRHQLLFVRNEMEQGAELWESMASLGLLSPAEVRVLETAGELGNRPWALEQLAAVRRRNTTLWLARLVDLALPVMVLLMGGVVLLYALSIFGPLIQLIDSLSLTS